jgi:hypothetical protein
VVVVGVVGRAAACVVVLWHGQPPG